MPTNDLIAALSQTLLHKLAIDRTASHRLSCSGRSSAARTHSGGTCRNIFQIRLMTTEQRTHHARGTNARCTSCCGAACVNLVHRAHIRLLCQ